MLIYRDAEGITYMARESLMTPVVKVNPIPSPRGALLGLDPKQSSKPPQIET